MGKLLQNLFVASILLLLGAGTVSGKIVLPAYFTDNMVLQQHAILKMKGHAAPSSTISVKVGWAKKGYSTISQPDGSFLVEIPIPSAGGPYEIHLSDGIDQLQLSNVLVGEVWFCSGQSNMEMPLAGWGRVMNYEQEIADADYPKIRLLQVKKKMAYTPLEEVEVNHGGWNECHPSTVPDFSALAYFYARGLWEKLHVPVGVIDCTWGGTPAESWTSQETLSCVEGFQEKIEEMRLNGFEKEALMAAYEEDMRWWEMGFLSQDAGYRLNKPLWAYAYHADWERMPVPGNWEQSALPDFDGVVWYQVELEIPAEWAGHDVSVSLGCMDDENITYFNGHKVGEGKGYTTFCKYVVPSELVRKGKNVLTVRITDFGGEGGFRSRPEDMYIEANGVCMALPNDWAYHVGMGVGSIPAKPVSPENSGYPSVLYNGMVDAMTDFPIKGVIWYQGEENAKRAESYAPLFQALIADWRKQWGYDFPFYFVQLAGYMQPREIQLDSQWAVLREAQAEALHLSNTGMVTAIDIGDPYDIHPKNKQEVGRRLAALSLSDTYGKGKYHMPACVGYTIKGNAMALHFDSKVEAKGDAVKGFILKDANGMYYPAQAEVDTDGKTVVLTSEKVNIPVAARYNWADCPNGNLYGELGYPVGPFRTDK